MELTAGGVVDSQSRGPNAHALMCGKAASNRAESMVLSFRSDEGHHCGVEEAVLLGDLEAVGIKVSDIWELVNIKQRYSAAIPILAEWLDRLADQNIDLGRLKLREGVVRALTVREARKSALPALVRAMDSSDARQDPAGFGWAVANALSVAADDSVYEDLARLASDTTLGMARQMLMYPIGRSERPSATQTLLRLVGQYDVWG